MKVRDTLGRCRVSRRLPSRHFCRPRVESCLSFLGSMSQLLSSSGSVMLRLSSLATLKKTSSASQFCGGLKGRYWMAVRRILTVRLSTTPAISVFAPISTCERSPIPTLSYRCSFRRHSLSPSRSSSSSGFHLHLLQWPPQCLNQSLTRSLLSHVWERPHSALSASSDRPTSFPSSHSHSCPPLHSLATCKYPRHCRRMRHIRSSLCSARFLRPGGPDMTKVSFTSRLVAREVAGSHLSLVPGCPSKPVRCEPSRSEQHGSLHRYCHLYCG